MNRREVIPGFTERTRVKPDADFFLPDFTEHFGRMNAVTTDQAASGSVGVSCFFML